MLEERWVNFFSKSVHKQKTSILSWPTQFQKKQLTVIPLISPIDNYRLTEYRNNQVYNVVIAVSFIRVSRTG